MDKSLEGGLHSLSSFLFVVALRGGLDCYYYGTVLSLYVDAKRFVGRCVRLLIRNLRVRRHLPTSSSAVAEGPRDALSQSKSCQLLRNCTKNHI